MDKFIIIWLSVCHAAGSITHGVVHDEPKVYIGTFDECEKRIEECMSSHMDDMDGDGSYSIYMDEGMLTGLYSHADGYVEYKAIKM